MSFIHTPDGLLRPLDHTVDVTTAQVHKNKPASEDANEAVQDDASTKTA